MAYHAFCHLFARNFPPPFPNHFPCSVSPYSQTTQWKIIRPHCVRQFPKHQVLQTLCGLGRSIFFLLFSFCPWVFKRLFVVEPEQAWLLTVSHSSEPSQVVSQYFTLNHVTQTVFTRVQRDLTTHWRPQLFSRAPLVRMTIEIWIPAHAAWMSRKMFGQLWIWVKVDTNVWEALAGA